MLRDYQQRFKFILVDEYQDTNVAQYLWLRLLAQRASRQHDGRNPSSPPAVETAASEPDDRACRSTPHADPHPSPVIDAADRNADTRRPKNICCVGDDDQSIYGWRGAEVDNILRFEKDFPGAKVIRLERNYRSTGHILAAASHLIAHNEGRLGKTLRTEDDDGEKVAVTSAWDSRRGSALDRRGDRGAAAQRRHSLDEIAILVRASFQMREFEDRFVTLGLPYRVIGGPRFYERAEIRDALAYLRLVNQPADDLAFERIVNVPKRGLGDATVKQLHDVARAQRRAAARSHARASSRPTSSSPSRARRCAISSPRSTAGARSATRIPHTRARRNRARRERLHRDVAEGPFRRRRRPARKPERARALDGGVREPAGLSRTHLAGDGHRRRRRRAKRSRS